MSEAIWDFLQGNGADHRGRTLQDILAFGDDALEKTHDYIQWLFPLPEASAFNASAPRLSPEDIRMLKGSPAARNNLMRATRRMERFYRDNGYWLTRHDHNHLRITRIIRSLALLVGAEEAERFHSMILERVAEAGKPVSEEACRYWSEALASARPR